jgi:hypothetical protein
VFPCEFLALFRSCPVAWWAYQWVSRAISIRTMCSVTFPMPEIQVWSWGCSWNVGREAWEYTFPLPLLGIVH